MRHPGDGSLRIDAVVERPGFTLEVSLEVPAGTTAVLLGPNGSGKSTVVAAVAGLVPLSAGTIELGDRVLDDPAAGVRMPSEERGLGVAFQDGLLFPHLSVVDNVAFSPVARGMPRREARAEARRLLDELALGAGSTAAADLAGDLADDLADRRPRTLSGGQAQRAVLARALAGRPDALLLDEPMSALDASVRPRLRRRLRGLLDGLAAPRLVITHDPTDAFLLADVIHVVEHGRITQSDTPAEIRRRPATAYAADLAGVNLLAGDAADGLVRLLPARPGAAGGAAGVTLRVADTSAAGPVLLTIGPRAATLHRDRPSGSPRNVWQTRVVAVEPLGDVTRVVLENPVRLNVDITPAAARELEIDSGSELWVAVKATEISVAPDPA